MFDPPAAGLGDAAGQRGPEAPADGISPARPGDEVVSAGQGRVEVALRRVADLIATSPHNLVSRRERAAVFERHVAECDALASLLHPAGQWLDLGTGGGLPGLVLAIRHPGAQWTLLDATAKKATAVRGFVEALALGNVEVVHGRAERLAHDIAHRGQYQGVVARAVAPMVTLVELGRGFLADGGHLVAVKGPAWREELREAKAALARLRLRVAHSERLPGGARQTWVVTMQAHGAPPQPYPRRDGVPQHDPLR